MIDAPEFYIDPDDFTWKDIGSCVGMDFNFFFDYYEEDKTIASNVDKMCMSCPVQNICADYGRENKQEGVWGGVYWTTSGKPDLIRNNHKTAEDWAELEDALGIPLMRRGKRAKNDDS